MNCPNCGAALTPNAEFCSYCGKALNLTNPQIQPTQNQQNYRQPQQAQQSQQYRQQNQQAGQYQQAQQYQQNQQYRQDPRYQQYYAQQYYAGQQTAAPKTQSNNKMKLFIGIGAGAVAVIAVIIVLLIVLTVGNRKRVVDAPAQGYTAENEQSYVSPGSTNILGFFENRVYENEWADIRFELPDGWREQQGRDRIDPSSYMGRDSGYFRFMIAEQKYISFGIVPVSDFSSSYYSNENILISIVGDLTSSSYVTINNREWTDATIGGHQYFGVDGTFTNGKTGDVYATSVYIRRNAQYLIIITIQGESIEANDEIMKTIKAF